MKKKLLNLLVALVLVLSLSLVMAVPAVAAPGTITFTPATGPIGSTTTVSGSGWGPSETIQSVTVGGKTAANILVVDGTGAISGPITIPNGLASDAAKDIVITGSVSGGVTSSAAFTVTPSASFNPASGPTSTVITVTGAGWQASETITAVTIGGTAANCVLTVDGTAVLFGTITVPVGLTAGTKDIVITGSASGAKTFANAFTAPGVAATFSPTTGPIGAVVNVSGTGWAVSETITGITVGGIAVVTHTLTVSAGGALSGTITIPSGASGVCAIVITGSVTGAKTCASTFTVASNTASFNPEFGPIGQSINVTGLGWGASESILSVTIGGLSATHTLTVSAGGALLGTITVPSGLTGGAKSIIITGSASGAVTFTGAFTVVTATATFTPATGPVGQEVNVSGTGWAASESIIAVTVGGVSVVTHTLVVSTGGALSGPMTVPAGVTGGVKNIVITGATSSAVTFTNAFTVTTTATFTPASGPVGQVITVAGTGWGASETISGVTVGGVAVVTPALTVSAGGALSGTITVPAGLTGGDKNIVITGSASGAKTFTNVFTVTASGTFTPANGPVGTIITVTGSGWGASESILSVTIGSLSATHTLSVSAAGALSGTITVPSGSTPGAKTVTVTGFATGGVALTGTYTVSTNTATFTPASGPVGQVITVAGTGWTASESIIAVTVGVVAVAVPGNLTVDVGGSLSGTITVPAGVTRGVKNIVITGDTSGAVTFTNAFTVTTAATFTPASGPVGQAVTVAGTGWGASETISGVTVGGVAVVTPALIVSAGGALSGTITVPAGLTGGAKSIVITGSASGAKTFTNVFTVTASGTFTPASGPVGTIITVTGSGWGASESILSVTIGAKTAAKSLSVSATGALSGTITVPSGLSTGAKNIVITGSSSGGVSFAGAFTVLSNTATFAPATGPVGTIITVSGTGWTASESITAVTVGETTATHTLMVSTGGALSGAVTVPASSATGIKNIVITGATSGAVTFTNAFTVVSYNTINLKTGWNLISLMVIPTNTSITSILSGVTVTSVWSYDAATGNWTSYAPGAPSALTTMVDGKGYWIYVPSDQTLVITGSALPAPPQTPPTYHVVVGWNLIGFKSTDTNKTLNDYLAGTIFTVSYEYDATTQSYSTVVPSSTVLIPGKGYWVAFTAAGMIYP